MKWVFPTEKRAACLAGILAVLVVSLTAGAREIRMVTTSWGPYYAEKLEKKGVVTEIVQAAFERAGQESSIDFIPWTRAMRAALTGEYDVVMGAYYSEMREEKFEYSEPIFEVEVGIIARKDLGIAQYQSLKDLSAYRFGIGQGWVNSPDFDNAHFLMKEAVVRPVLNLRKMKHRRIDLMVMSVKVFEYEMEESGFKGELETVVLKPLLAENPLYLMVPKTHPERVKIIQDFNRGLRAIKRDGTYEKILQRHGFGE